MNVDAFLIRGKMDKQSFIQSFLASTDFTQNNLKKIARNIGISSESKSSDLIDAISNSIKPYNENDIKEIIIKQLILREKEWCSIKIGNVSSSYVGGNCLDLVDNEGEGKLYGPIYIEDSSDKWYIRPVFIKHLQWNDIDKKYDEHRIRWLCFIRINGKTMSLHWRGFSHLEKIIADESDSDTHQFQYWKHIPKIFNEVEKILNIQVVFANIYKTILFNLWDEFYQNKNYIWDHKRIRAEANGVMLSAYAGRVVRSRTNQSTDHSENIERNSNDIVEEKKEDDQNDKKGIFHLANTICQAINNELQNKFNYELPDIDHFDFVILRTLIREYGALSYEFKLENGDTFLFRAHAYFGVKKLTISPDMFPHIRFIHIAKRHPLEQLNLIIDYLEAEVDRE